MKPRDITRLRTVSDPRLHPDGDLVAFVVRRAELPEDDAAPDAAEPPTTEGESDGQEKNDKKKKDRYVSEIWVWDGDEARPFTHGPTDASPRWSPDGRHLAFVRKGEADDAKPQVALMRADGGEARILTDFPLGAGGFEWSPDGSRLAVVGATWIDELAGLDDDERKRRPRRITHPQWNLDNEGWTHDKRRHIYLVDPFDDDAEPFLLTPGDFDEGGPRWHPDGDRIAFVSSRHDARHLEPGNQAWEVDVSGGEPRPLTEVGMWYGVSWRPDGVPHVYGLPGQWDWPDVERVFRVEEDGSLTDLTGHLDLSISPSAPTCVPNEPHWIDGTRFVTLVEDRGRVRVAIVDADGGVSDVLGGDRCITGVAPRPGAAAFAFTATDPTDPGELHWWEEGDERVITELNEEFRREVPLVAPTYFTYDESGVEVDAWIFSPEGGEEKVPLLFNIHGGPSSQYGWYFFDEFQVYAGAGYGVVATNPRGSSGRGRDWVRGVVGRWHEDSPPDLDDLRAAVDAAVDREARFDVDRVGVMGGSYGGYITARIIAVDHRFRSAIVERGLLAWPSFAGTSDIGTYFDRMYLDAQLPDAYDLLWRASPVARAHETRTPTLVLHSEQDFRCPIEQAEQYFVLLQRHGVESEFVRFPGEGHELSRSGQPRHRVERFEIVLDWHARHLAP